MKREEVKKVAVAMVKSEGLINLSRRKLCERAGIPDGSFPHVMGCSFVELVNELKLENIQEIPHSVNKSRADPTLRKDHILSVAVDMAKTEGYSHITRDKIAESAGVSMGLVTRYFGTMGQLKTAVMRRAVKQGISVIVAQGIANCDSQARKAPDWLKADAVKLLADF